MQVTNGRPTSTSFFEEVIAETPGVANLEVCIQCGSCGGSCPSGEDMEHTPRLLFALIRAGMREQVLRSNTPWYCVSCYYCMARCRLIVFDALQLRHKIDSNHTFGLRLTQRLAQVVHERLVDRQIECLAIALENHAG